MYLKAVFKKNGRGSEIQQPDVTCFKVPKDTSTDVCVNLYRNCGKFVLLLKYIVFCFKFQIATGKLMMMDATEIWNGFLNLTVLLGLIVYIVTFVMLLLSVLASIFCGSYDHQVSWSFIPKTLLNIRPGPKKKVQ